MKAEDVLKIALESQPKPRDIRLAQFIEWLDRDIVLAAKQSKLSFTVDYSSKALTREFIFNIQEYLRENNFIVFVNEDPTKYREFKISWNIETNGQ